MLKHYINQKYIFNLKIKVYLLNLSYSVEVNKISKVLGSLKERAVVSCEALPSSMEVISHHVDEVKIARDSVKY